MMKDQLLELYEDALVLGKNMDLEHTARYMLKTLYPGKVAEELNEDELLKLIKAIVTGLTSQVC